LKGDLPPRRLLITGADGFTGTHLVSAAVFAGWDVAKLVADLTDLTSIRHQIARYQPHAIIHLGAISAVTHADLNAFYQVNVVGTDNLLSAVLKEGLMPHQIILASSANVYGNESEGLLNESAPLRPINHYGVSKVAMEHVGGFYKHTLPILVTRAFNYTGVGHDERFVIPKLVAHFKKKAASVEVGDVDVEREFNDVRFVAQAYLKLLHVGVPQQTYNLCSGRLVKLRYVIKLLEKLSGHKLEVKVNPAFLRTNEIRALGGSPLKLNAVLGSFKEYKLEETLQWMLEQSTRSTK
jgi:GDP-6-deoxy-D-talose 4-dehydrogenase